MTNKTLIILLISIFLISFTSAAITTTLNSPANGGISYTNPTTFNATGNTSSPNYLMNMSLYTNITGSWTASNTTSISGVNVTFNLTRQGTIATESAAPWAGLTFQVFTNTTLTSVRKSSSSTANMAFLYVSSSATTGNQLVNASFVGDYAYFNYPLNTSATYFILGGASDGGGYTRTYDNVGVSYPQNNSLVNVTQGVILNSATLTTNFRNIEQINTTISVNNFNPTWNLTVPSGTTRWNVLTCDNSSSCSFAASNFTFNLDSTGPTIVMNNPTNTTYSYGYTGLNVSVNATITDTNLDKCWYKYNGVNTTFTCGTVPNLSLISGNSQNLTVFSNDTVGNINYNYVNWSYKFFLNSQNYSLTANEGTTEIFTVNGSIYNSTYQVSSANLTYNGTNYSGSLTQNGNDYFINTTANIPDVSSLQNLSFYWTIILTDGTSIQTNSSNQTVTPLLIDNCSVYTYRILNYTLRDENTQAIVNNGTIKVTVKLNYFNTSTTFATFYNQFNNTNNASVCLNASLVSSAYSLLTEVEYYQINYSTRHNFVQMLNLNSSSVPQNTTLFLLNSSLSQAFLITFKDSVLSIVEGALINIQRQYFDENTFKTVQIERTDSNGQATGYFDLTNNGIYNIVVTKNGVILGTFEKVALSSCGLGYTCALNLNSATQGITYPSYESAYNWNYALSINTTTRYVNLQFSTTDSSVTTARLEVNKFDMYGNTSICNSSITTSAGTLSCLVPTLYGNSSILVKVYKDNELVLSDFYSMNDANVNSYFSGNSAILVLILLLTFPLFFIPSLTWTLVASVVGFIASGLLLFTAGGVVGTTAFITSIVISAGVILWKLNQRGID